jgi:hypothetical protein
MLNTIKSNTKDSDEHDLERIREIINHLDLDVPDSFVESHPHKEKTLDEIKEIIESLKL